MWTMSEPSDAERKRIADLEAKVLELQQREAEKDKLLAQKEEVVKTYHDEKRQALDATAPQVQEFFKLLGADEAAVPYQVEHNKMAQWATNMCKDENPTASLQLGRVMVTASVRDKRQRDEIENLRASTASMSDVAKERDELRAEVEVLRQKNTGLTEECTAKQTAIEKLSVEMKKYETLGMAHPAVAETHKFSQLHEREKPPASMTPEAGSSTTPVSEQRPSFTSWVMSQTSHLSDDNLMNYREKSAGGALPLF